MFTVSAKQDLFGLIQGCF